MSWCFAIVNNKFAEIYFDRKKNGQIEIKGHCYPKRDEFKTKTEQKQIAQDTKKFRFVYRNNKVLQKDRQGIGTAFF